MAVALVALFVALGGGAYAGVTLANNSVLSKHIKNGEVRKGDLAANAVTGDKIKDGEVKGAEVADGSLGGADIADGSVGDADIAGVAAGKISGKVASAASADTTANATNATTAQTANKLTTNPATAKAFASNELLRVAHAGVTDDTTITFNAGLNNFQTLTSLTIAAPQAGYVRVNSVATAHTDDTSGCPCFLGTRIRHDTANAVIFTNNATIGNAIGGVTADNSMASTWVYPVSAGANVFSLEGSVFAGTATVLFSRYRLTALFVPFNKDGNAP